MAKAPQLSSPVRIVRLLDRGRDRETAEPVWPAGGDPAASGGNLPDVERHLVAIEGEEIPDETRALLRCAATDHREQLAQLIASCLGLKRKRGQRSWTAEIDQRERDRWLAVAWDEMGGSSYRRAQDLAAEIGVTLELHWPAWRNKDAPPAGITPLRRALFFACKASNGDLPQSWRSLRALVLRVRELPERAASCSTTDPA